MDAKKHLDKRQADQNTAGDIAKAAGNDNLKATILKLLTKQSLSDTDRDFQKEAQAAIIIFERKKTKEELRIKLSNDAYDKKNKKLSNDIAAHSKRPKLADQIYRKVMGYNTVIFRGDVEDQEIVRIIAEYDDT